MNKIPVDSMDEILGQFDIEDIDDILEDQLGSNDPELDYPKDIFKAIFMKYKEALETYDFTDEDKNTLDDRFSQICDIVITKVARMFNIEINDDAQYERAGDKPAVAMILYGFFIIDYMSVAESILMNYILKNRDDINSIYESLGAKKDSATMHYRNEGVLPEPYLIIISNIVNISEWIFDRFEVNKDFLDYLDDDYYIAHDIKEMCRSGFISGSFVQRYSEIFRDSLTMKGLITVDICNTLQKKAK